MTVEPTEYSFLRYLAAKQSVDDRSLNRQVRETLAAALGKYRGHPPLQVLEVGCGHGAMLERLLDWRLLPESVYTGIDFNPELIAEARRRRRERPSQRVAAYFQAIDLCRFLARDHARPRFDLILAHAFLDLVDLETTLPALLNLLAPGGLFYFTLNFDGSTVFLPTLNSGLDRLIETLYHQTMDQRRVEGRLTGGSRTGRRLLARLSAAGAAVLAAGSSDWVVFPGDGGYLGDEAYFLHFIIHTVDLALQGHPALDAAAFRTWVKERHEQIRRSELIYLARQLDCCGQV